MLSGNILASDRLNLDQNFVAFIGSSLTFRECHLNAVQSEYPELHVRRYSDIIALTLENETHLQQIKVVLFDEALADEVAQTSKRLRQLMPSTIFAMSLGRAQPAQEDMDWVVDNSLVKSLLPMDLRLNVWLSAIRLMVDGGQYLPQPAPRQIISRPEPIALPVMQSAPEPVAIRTLHLTPREADVLALLEQGLQNKLIADRLKLSEHTVKLHIHRIISKLGATNRTQAVLLYQQHQSGASDAAAIHV